MDTSPSSLIRTSDEQSGAIELLEEMLAENFKKTPNPKSANKSFFLKNFYSYLIDRINSESGNRENIKIILENILSEVKNLKKIKITLASQPDETTIENLGKWLNNNQLQNYIFDVALDKKILGGAVITGQKGDYKDFSLSKNIDDYLNQAVIS
jgi:F0F1-type ATP synthase delta subunit